MYNIIVNKLYSNNNNNKNSLNNYNKNNNNNNMGIWNHNSSSSSSSSNNNNNTTTTIINNNNNYNSPTSTITLSSTSTTINELLEEAIQQNYEVIESWIQSNQQHFSNVYDTLVYIYLDLENFRVSSVYRSHPTYKTSKKNQVGFTCIFSGIGKYTKLTQSTFYSQTNGLTNYNNPNISNFSIPIINNNSNNSSNGSMSPSTMSSLLQSLNSNIPNSSGSNNNYNNSSGNNSGNNSGRESPAFYNNNYINENSGNSSSGFSNNYNLYYNNFINLKNNIYDSAHFVLVHSINRALDKLINTILTHTLVYDQVISYKRGEGLDFPHIQLSSNPHFLLSPKQQQIRLKLNHQFNQQHHHHHQHSQQHTSNLQRQLFKLSNDSTNGDLDDDDINDMEREINISNNSAIGGSQLHSQHHDELLLLSNEELIEATTITEDDNNKTTTTTIDENDKKNKRSIFNSGTFSDGANSTMSSELSPVLSSNSIHNIYDGSFDYSKKVYPQIKRTPLERSSTSPSLSASLEILSLNTLGSSNSFAASTTTTTAVSINTTTTTTTIVNNIGETLSSSYLVTSPSTPSVNNYNNHSNSLNSLIPLPTSLSSSNTTTTGSVNDDSSSNLIPIPIAPITNISNDTNSINNTTPTTTVPPSILQTKLSEISKQIGELPSLNISETNDGNGSACISSLYGWDFEKKQQFGSPFADCFCITTDAHPMIKAVLSVADGSGHGEDPKRAAQMSILGANQYIESLFDQDIPTTNDLLTVVGNSIFEGHKRIIEDEYYQQQEIHIEPRGATTFCIGVLSKSINENLNNSLINSNSNKLISIKNNNNNNNTNNQSNNNNNTNNNNNSNNNTININGNNTDIHVNHFKSYIKPSTQSSKSRKNNSSSSSSRSINNSNNNSSVTINNNNNNSNIEQINNNKSGETSPNNQTVNTSPVISSQRCLSTSSDPIVIPLNLNRSSSVDEEISSIMSESPELVGFSNNKSYLSGNNSPRFDLSNSNHNHTSPPIPLPSNNSLNNLNNNNNNLNNNNNNNNNNIKRIESHNPLPLPPSYKTSTSSPSKTTVPPKLPPTSTPPRPQILMMHNNNNNNNLVNNNNNNNNVNNNSNEINAPWVFLIGSVGDTKAYRWSHSNGKVTEITNRSKNVSGNSGYGNNHQQQHHQNNVSFVNSQQSSSSSSSYSSSPHSPNLFSVSHNSSTSNLSQSPTPSPLLSSTPTSSFTPPPPLGPRNFNEAGGQLGWMWGGDMDRSWPIEAPSYPTITGPASQKLKEELLKARNEKGKPLLTNLHFAMILVSPGDRVFIVSDGISDNFLNFDIDQNSTIATGTKVKTPREQIEENMTQFLAQLPKDTISSCEQMSSAIVTYCIEKTDAFRSLQEEISKLLLKMKEIEKTPDFIKDPLYQSYKKQHSQKSNALRKIKVGKPDHSSIVIYEVPFE